MHPATAELLHRHGGAIQSSRWVSGTHQQTTRRPIPPGCRMIYAKQIHTLPEPARTRAGEILTKHPRVKWFIAYTNI